MRSSPKINFPTFVWIFLQAFFETCFATPSACYRRPKPQNWPKWLGEGAKGVLAIWRKASPKSLFHQCNGVFCTSATGSWSTYTKTPFAPSPNLVTLVFSYSPPPPDSSPHHRPPLTMSQLRVVFRSFSSRFRDDFESQIKIDSKTTRNWLPMRGGVGGGGMSRGGGGGGL